MQFIKKIIFIIQLSIYCSKMSAEDRAAKAAEDLKKRVELGIDDSRPECDRETEVSFVCIFDYLVDFFSSLRITYSE